MHFLATNPTPTRHKEGDMEENEIIVLLALGNWFLSFVFTYLGIKYFFGENSVFIQKVLLVSLILVFCTMICNLVVTICLIF